MTLEDLQLCARYKRDVDRIEEEIKRIQSEMERTTQTLSLAPAKTGNFDKLADSMSRMLELKAERAEKRAKMEAHIDHCENWLLTIPEQQAAVMRCRYIDGMKWNDVVNAVNYCRSHCFNIRKSAMDKLER